jgi:hypothetical protein
VRYCLLVHQALPPWCSIRRSSVWRSLTPRRLRLTKRTGHECTRGQPSSQTAASGAHECVTGACRSNHVDITPEGVNPIRGACASRSRRICLARDAAAGNANQCRYDKWLFMV